LILINGGTIPMGPNNLAVFSTVPAGAALRTRGGQPIQINARPQQQLSSLSILL
jgi:hypothetical protein